MSFISIYNDRMELRQLEYFSAVARHRQFTRASRALSVAQPAVSQQIKRLEAELGLELLRRTTREVELTDAGAVLLVRANRVLGEIEAARQELSEISGLLRGSVEIGALPVASIDTPDLVAGFYESYPHVAIHLHELTLALMLSMLRSDELDLCFALVDPAELGADLDGVLLYHEELIAMVSTAHELAGRSWISLQGLAAEPLIRFRTGSAIQRAIDDAFDRAGIVPGYAFQTFELETMRALANRGLGVALVPGGYLKREGPAVARISIRPRVEIPVSLIWRSDRRRPPAAEAFLTYARERVGEGHSSMGAAGFEPATSRV
jgi:DNA-binding transcriptional LysR family regulator